jgi:hypothetical protein
LKNKKSHLKRKNAKDLDLISTFKPTSPVLQPKTWLAISRFYSIRPSFRKKSHFFRWVFTDSTKTKKSVFITMLTTFGVQTNEHYVGQVQNQIKMDALFESL